MEFNAVKDFEIRAICVAFDVGFSAELCLVASVGRVPHKCMLNYSIVS